MGGVLSNFKRVGPVGCGKLNLCFVGVEVTHPHKLILDKENRELTTKLLGQIHPLCRQTPWKEIRKM